MLFKYKMLGAQGKVLRRSFIAVDAISKANPVEGGGVEAMEAMGGNKDLHAVTFLFEKHLHLQIGGIAQRMCVLSAEVSDLLGLNALNAFRQEDELMAKPRDKTCGLHVARIE